MGLFSSSSAKRAAAVQASYMSAAEDMVKAGRDEYIQNYQPYMEAGQAAIPQYNAALSTTQNMISGLDSRYNDMYNQVAALQPQVGEMYDLSKQVDPVIQDILSGGQGFTASPGYDFRFNQGQRALEASQAAGGMLNSGATGKALVEYGQGVASDEFSNYMNRQYQALNAVNTQLSGRQAALGAGQSQINTGLGIAGSQLNQITAQQNLNNQYQALINQGMSAADAAARLGMNATYSAADLRAGQGGAFASGMMAKDAELKNLGAAATQLVSTAAGAALGGAGGGGITGAMQGAQIGSQIGGSLGGGGQAQMMPYYQTPALSSPQYTNIGNQMPWLQTSNTSNPALGTSNIAAQEMARAKSGYNTTLNSRYF